MNVFCILFAFQTLLPQGFQTINGRRKIVVDIEDIVLYNKKAHNILCNFA